MKTLFAVLIAAVVAGMALAPDHAEAKRFGAGKSFGKQYTMPRQATPPRQATQTPARQQPAAGQTRPQSGMGRWLGPLAGLAAGGLLASLFFGDAFEGFQVMDFLLIAALIFGGFMLFKMLRGRAAPAARGGPVGAGAGVGSGPSAVRDGGVGTNPFHGMPGMSGSTAPGPAAAPSAATASAGPEVPAWFDDAAFAEGAKTHFIRLQAAWDASDFRDIREYTTPQLFAELKREREAMGEAPNYTEVVTLSAELLSVQRDKDQVVASVRFSGLIREEEQGSAKPLDEVWHVAHDWDTPDGDWLISGIQQTA